jgi:mercuric ion transport protein
LLLAGVGTSWLGTVHRLQPLWPVFMVITAGTLGYAAWRIFRTPKPGDWERACANVGELRRRKALFWVAVVLNAGMFLGTYLLFYVMKSSS